MQTVPFHIMQCVLSPTLQLILQDHCHKDAHNADDQTAKEGVPPDGVTDHQFNTERLTDDARQPEQEGVDDQREQPKGQDDQWAGQELEQRAEQRIDDAEDQGKPDDRNQSAT